MTIECIRYTAVNKGTLLGYADLFIVKMGLEIYGCTLHQKDGRRWINFPAKEYIDSKTGEKKYASVVRFREKGHMDAFGEKAKEAIEKKAALDAHSQPPKGNFSEEIPF